MRSYYLLYRMTVGISMSVLMKAKTLYNAKPATTERELNVLFSVGGLLQIKKVNYFMLAP